MLGNAMTFSDGLLIGMGIGLWSPPALYGLRWVTANRVVGP